MRWSSQVEHAVRAFFRKFAVASVGEPCHDHPVLRYASYGLLAFASPKTNCIDYPNTNGGLSFATMWRCKIVPILLWR